MASYQIYVPGEKRENAQAVFPDVGLADLLADGDSAPMGRRVVQGGPDGGFGVVFKWDDPRRPEFFGVRLSTQRWEKYADGAYWFGCERDAPPRPDDLLWSKVPTGDHVAMHDGNAWLIPAMRHFPKVLVCHNGTVEGEPPAECAAYAAWLDRAVRWFLPDEGPPRIPWDAGMQFCAVALRQNYRVNLHAVSFLRLIDERSLQEVVKAAIEWDAIESHLLALEKKTSDPTSGQRASAI